MGDTTTLQGYGQGDGGMTVRQHLLSEIKEAVETSDGDVTPELYCDRFLLQARSDEQRRRDEDAEEAALRAMAADAAERAKSEEQRTVRTASGRVSRKRNFGSDFINQEDFESKLKSVTSASNAQALMYSSSPRTDPPYMPTSTTVYTNAKTPMTSRKKTKTTTAATVTPTPSKGSGTAARGNAGTAKRSRPRAGQKDSATKASKNKTAAAPAKPKRAPPKKSQTKTTGNWTEKEDELFDEALVMYGHSWVDVAAHIGTRYVLDVGNDL